MIGTYNNGTWGLPDPWGDDYAHMIEIQQFVNGDELNLVRRASLHAYCSVDDSRQCNYDAAAGIYVDPNGQLAIYSTEHDNDGPDVTVKLMEYWQNP